MRRKDVKADADEGAYEEKDADKMQMKM